MDPSVSFTAVIAAAGLSSRMGAFKPALPLGSESISRRLILSFIEAGAGSVTVVTGFMAETLAGHLKGLPVHLVHNEAYRTSQMFDSLYLGLASLPEPGKELPERIFLCPADIPLIRPETIVSMTKQEANVVIPVCGGRKGHPVCVASSLLPLILSHDGTDGLRGALKAFQEETCFLNVPDPGILADADTMEDYKKIKEAYTEVFS